MYDDQDQPLDGKENSSSSSSFFFFVFYLYFWRTFTVSEETLIFFQTIKKLKTKRMYYLGRIEVSSASNEPIHIGGTSEASYIQEVLIYPVSGITQISSCLAV